MSEEIVRLGPIDLSRENDFSLGALQICPSTREVVRDGQRETLEPKSIQVLIALHQARGRVVSRDDLIVRCWDGRIVGEDSINRVIWRLRRLSEVDGGANFTIETIAKVGYRLLTAASGTAPALAESPGPAAERSTPARPNILMRHGLAFVAAIAIVIAATTTWLFWPDPRWQVETSRPFLSTLELEGEPAFSPDGSQLAYTSGAGGKRGVFVKNMGGGDRINVSADEVAATSPSWSSDGSHLVYLSVEFGKPCRIMLATVPAGGVREVGRCRKALGRSSVTWQPGTRFIYFIDSQENGTDGIYRLDLDTGVRDAVVALYQAVQFYDLRCSPDGRWLLYAENTLPAGTNRIVVRDLTNGKETIAARVLNPPTSVWQNSAAWSEDSKTILVSAASGGGSDILAFPIDGQKSYKIYSSANPIGHIAMGRGGRLAAESILSRKNLARASPTPVKQPDQLDMASGITFAPSFAQDGTMVFLSNRNGSDALWIKRPDKEAVLLFDAGADAPFRAAIAPDGRHIAVANFVLNHEGVIRILTADGASAGNFNVGYLPAGFPTWTPDSKALVIYDEKSDQAVRAEIDNPSRRTPVAPPSWMGVSIRDSGVYAIRRDKPGVWRIDGGPKLISSKYPLGFGPPLAFRGDDLLIPDFGAESGARILAQPLSGGPDRVIAYAPGAEDPRYQSKIAVDPTNGEIIYVASVVNDTNIDILTLVRR